MILLALLASAQTVHGAMPAKDTVWVGIYLHAFTDFNLSNNTYQADARLWMRYKNSALHPEELLRFENAKEVTELETLRKHNNGWHWVLQRRRVTVQHEWDIQHFPFNTEQLSLVLLDPFAVEENRIYLPDDDAISCAGDGVPIGWYLQGSALTSTPITYASRMGLAPLGFTAQAKVVALTASLTLARRGEDLIFKLYVGLFVAFLISWLTFFIEPTEVDPRFGLSVGGIFAAIGNKYILDANLADISASSLTDWMHLVTFVSIVLTVAIGIVSLYLHKQGRINQYKRLDRLAAVCMLAFYVATVSGMMWAAVR